MSIQTASVELTFHNNKTCIVIRTPQGTSVIEAESPHFHNGGIQHGKVYTGLYKPNPEVTGKRVTAKRQKRASIKQEESIMEELGGRRHPGSGAIPGLKGDGRVRDKYRVEAKHTRKEGFRITREDLNKIRGECTGNEVPLYVVGFVDPLTGGSEDRWVMLPFEVFLRMNKTEEALDHAANLHR